MARIVVLDGYTLNPGDNPWDAVAALGELTVHDRTPPALTVERAKDADIVLTNKALITADDLAQLPKLKFIGILATGFNIVDVAAARKRGIAVSNVPEYSTRSVAQYVMAAMLEFCHRLRRHSDLVQGGAWVRSTDFAFWDAPLLDLEGKTIGIVGFGRIGQEVGRLAHAFGMKVIAHSRSRSQKVDYPMEWRDLDDLFAEADAVSLHCPQTADNAGFVNAALLRRMKPSAWFLNTGRGGLVVEADLAQALHEGWIAAAAVDVISREPMTGENPLRGCPNLLITPHIAWATVGARQRLMAATAENIRAFQAGAPVNVVN